MPPTSPWSAHPDPYLFLEELHAPKALAWVAEQNQRSRQRWQSGPVFEDIRRALEQAYLPHEQPVAPGRQREWAYDTLVNDAHPKGLWRRTPWVDWRAGTAQWQTLLDVDALSEAEAVAWQLVDIAILYPDGDRALVSLSPGGSDAFVVREFDVDACVFINDGFVVNTAGHHGVSWIDRDTVYLVLDTGSEDPADVTRSGFPRHARRWSRGTSPENAPVVFSGEVDDDVIGVYFNPYEQRHEAWRSVDFFDVHAFFLNADGQWQSYGLPSEVQVACWQGWLILSPRLEWQCQGVRYPGGAVLVVREAEFFADDWASLTVLFLPAEKMSSASWHNSKHYLLLSYLDDLRCISLICRPLQAADGKWSWEKIDLALPVQLDTTVSAIAPELNDEIYVTTTGYLSSVEYWLADLAAPFAWEQLTERTLIGRYPEAFKAETLEIRRCNAISADGTQIPYVVIGAREALSGQPSLPSPCLLTGYGGFGVTLDPYYLAGPGVGWLTGGIYVVAHIRGGGEFGEQWHQAAQREMRQRSFDDFIAVAEDLISSGLTTSAKLGIQGASNGGLLVAACMVQRPDLFGAVVCEVALLDMRRYPHLHTGALWLEEYGDPDDEHHAQALAAYSPYHHVQAGTRYPPLLLMTSINDDRVHPGHARKMAALMQAQGHDEVWYLEGDDGGHGVVDGKQSAQRDAVIFNFLRQELGG